MRIAIGGLYQESHSFSPAPADRGAFEGGSLLYGRNLIEELAGLNHEIGGALSAAVDHEAIPLLYAATGASGMPVRQSVLEEFVGDFLQRLSASLPVDGVYLAMHGATAGEHLDDPTGHLFSRLRELVGPDVPIVASLDLHANVTKEMVDASDALVGYHTAPHIDQGDTGARAMRALIQAMEGTRLTTALRQIPMVVPGENGRTTEGPYAGVMDRAIKLEDEKGIVSASVFCVQPWLDLPEMGCSTVVVTQNDPERAQREADRLAEMLWSRRRDFTPHLVSVDDGIDRALADTAGPYVFSDAADAPSSGAPGDSTVLIDAFLRRGLQETVLLNILDPDAVSSATAVGVGNRAVFTLGASLSDTFYGPVTFDARVRTLFDGSFRFKGPAFKGVEFHMGRTAVLVSGGLHLVVMEQPILQWDPELYRCVGLDPADAKIVVAKSPAAFRAGYEPFAAQILNIDCPGVCSPNLKSFPWKRASRPLFPLDDDASFVVT